MPTVSFKADEKFTTTVKALASRSGINVSAFMKMLLTRGIDEEMSRVTSNGFTVAEELGILATHAREKTSKNHSSAASLIAALNA